MNDKLVIRGSTGMERLEIVRQRTMVEEDVFGKRAARAQGFSDHSRRRPAKRTSFCRCADERRAH